MTTLKLTDLQAEALRDALDTHLHGLAFELSRTDDRDARWVLSQLQRQLAEVRAQLGERAPQPLAPDL